VSADAQSGIISEQIAEVDSELERFRGLRPGLEELRRQVTADESNYLNYLTKVGTTPPQDYRVQVGDELDIKFFFNPELNESVLVRPDGRIALQLIGEVSIVGFAVEEIRSMLIEKYAGQLKNPEIAVLLRSSHVRAGESGFAPGSPSGGGGGGS
jgi:protein involved in polysaccharide export with SLBB domain